MDFKFLGDYDHDSGLLGVTDWLYRHGYREAFAKDYGDGLRSITVILLCSKHTMHLKPRIRHVKKEKSLDMDLMLPYPEFPGATKDERIKKVLTAILDEVPRNVRKYKFADFDTELLISDFNKYFSDLLFELPQSPALAA
ncbi:hypothetical protein [Massilia antarctica]|uniref:hypothetical protein n=1 Tax=Massilia antarctica TaxID=2765360 RepID=UPI0006BB9799|nr:hypothetical protein [Massilia sp. H27-R4]MCY0914176.1 hypothetical protein [Massilia sp. H27-R4]